MTDTPKITDSPHPDDIVLGGKSSFSSFPELLTFNNQDFNTIIPFINPRENLQQEIGFKNQIHELSAKYVHKLKHFLLSTTFRLTYSNFFICLLS